MGFRRSRVQISQARPASRPSAIISQYLRLRCTATGYAAARRISCQPLTMCLSLDGSLSPNVRAVLVRTSREATGVPTAEDRFSDALLSASHEFTAGAFADFMSEFRRLGRW